MKILTIVTIFFLFSNFVMADDITKFLLRADATEARVNSVFSYMGGSILLLSGIGNLGNPETITTAILSLVFGGALFWAGASFGNTADILEKEWSKSL